MTVRLCLLLFLLVAEGQAEEECRYTCLAERRRARAIPT